LLFCCYYCLDGQQQLLLLTTPPLPELHKKKLVDCSHSASFLSLFSTLPLAITCPMVAAANASLQLCCIADHCPLSSFCLCCCAFTLSPHLLLPFLLLLLASSHSVTLWLSINLCNSCICFALLSSSWHCPALFPVLHCCGGTGWLLVVAWCFLCSL